MNECGRAPSCFDSDEEISSHMTRKCVLIMNFFLKVSGSLQFYQGLIKNDKLDFIIVYHVYSGPDSDQCSHVPDPWWFDGDETHDFELHGQLNIL